jgi:hypothetical protein
MTRLARTSERDAECQRRGDRENVDNCGQTTCSDGELLLNVKALGTYCMWTILAP